MSVSRYLCILASMFPATLLQAQTQPVFFQRFEYVGSDSGEGTEVGAHGYRNPLFCGFYPDPSICRAGDDFYIIFSSFAYFPGIPIFHSRDLVNWNQIGHVISRPTQLRYDGANVSEAIFAPTIRYYKGVCYVICTMVGGEGNFVVTAKDPSGSWSDPILLDFEGIDPSLFFDDDGRAWVVNNGAPEGKPLYEGHRAIWLQEFDLQQKKMIGARKVLVNGGIDLSKKPIWIEGPHIYKKEGWYYLCCAEGGTGPQHSQVILRSRQVDGPYTAWDHNPILSQRDLSPDVAGAVTCTGHADFVVGPDQNWWAVFLGVRPYLGRYSPMGRETFLLPVKWTDDGWPTILPKGERVPLAGQSPCGAIAKPTNESPLNGDFTSVEDFKSAGLSSSWIMLRTPSEAWWEVDPVLGHIAIIPRSTRLSDQGNPSFLARRVQHARFSASTTLESPLKEQISAGLAIYQNEKHHYFMALRRDANGLGIYVERHNGGNPEVLASAHLSEVSKVKMRVRSNSSKCSFEYSTLPGAWVPLAVDADATLLTTEVAGGFVGATVGIHARVDQ